MTFRNVEQSVNYRLKAAIKAHDEYIKQVSEAIIIANQNDRVQWLVSEIGRRDLHYLLRYWQLEARE